MNLVIFLLSLTAGIAGIGIRAVEPMLPVIAADFGVSVPVAASVVTVFAFCYAFGQFIHGPLGDRVGKLPVITVATLVAAAALAGCATAPDLGTLTLWRAFTGLAQCAPFMLGLAYIGDTVPLERRQQVIGYYVTGNVLGHTCAPVISGVVTDTFGWRTSFIVLSALFAASGLLLAAFTRARWREEKRAGAGRGVIAGYAEVLRLPKARLFVACTLAEAFVYFGANAYFAAMLKERFDLSYTLIGIALAGHGAGGFLFNVLIRWMTAWFDQRSLLGAGGIGCGLVFLLLAWLPAWPLIFPAFIALGFCFYMIHNVIQLRATEAVPHARGIGLSAFGFAWTMGQGLGVAAMGGVIALAGYAPMIAGCGVGMALFGWWMRRNLHRLPGG